MSFCSFFLTKDSLHVLGLVFLCIVYFVFFGYSEFGYRYQCNFLKALCNLNCVESAIKF